MQLSRPSDRVKNSLLAVHITPDLLAVDLHCKIGSRRHQEMRASAGRSLDPQPPQRILERRRGLVRIGGKLQHDALGTWRCLEHDLELLRLTVHAGPLSRDMTQARGWTWIPVSPADA